MSTLKPPFNRLLVANRGEIAIRIFRAATELGIRTIGIYSYEDRFALYRFKADEAYQVGEPGQPRAAYLDYEAIISLAKRLNVDAIHPGYGFLSENDVFARRCAEEGITFIGPDSDTLQRFGDKVMARQVAEEASIPVIPGTAKPVGSVDEALELSKSFGFPVTLKAVSGGGGKGIRMIESADALKDAFDRARSEALSSFGRADIYIEKMIPSPKHIEVQILADKHGNVVHLYERDCSIQRRHQKVVEVAPALGVPDEVKSRLYEYAIAIAKTVNYCGLGTVEFLVSDDGNAYFLEVNPRVQVEHTVTEMITGYDLLQASILVASGVPLSDPRIGIGSQKDITLSGAAIQCRITTEDPSRNFAPDTGTIIAYRPAAGFGIRLDEGHGTAGGVITPHYDSLLVKVTSWGKTIEQAAAKMRRSLGEFRIRGVRHNIPLLQNVVTHPAFLAAQMHTNFLERHPELFTYRRPRDRATRLLRYIADVTVNNPHGLQLSKNPGESELPQMNLSIAEAQPKAAGLSAKEAFDQGGPEGLVKWLKSQQRLQVTDTTLRDAHQSLFATRLRTHDIMAAAPFYKACGHAFFSLEMWGGATFDTALRFLKEDPWERLTKVREAVPNVLLQMLLRGDNAVGYTNYPEWVIREFIYEASRSGLDLFRIFDCLNQVDKMRIAVDAVKESGKIAEVCICYTGNVIDPTETKYTLDYYVDLAKKIAAMGADLLAIKDMAGLLRPKAASILIRALREAVDLPIHLHMHDTSGAGVATLLEAATAGCDIVDGAVSSMAGLTSQPSLNALVASLGGDPRCPDVSLDVLDELGRFWGVVRSMYTDFDPGIRSTSTDVYRHEIPGGQYSNLFHQARKVGVTAHEFYDLTERYREVNEVFGNIIKVTPSSKVVGDFALMLQKHGLTARQWLEEKRDLDYPDSVVSFFKGHMGVPYGGFPEDARRLVLGENPPPPAPPVCDDQDSFEQVEAELKAKAHRPITRSDVLSYRLYPKVFLDYLKHQKQYGNVHQLSTPVFFYGLEQDQEYATELEPGKTLIISLNGISEAHDDGLRTAFFSLNGFPREIEIQDQSLESQVKRRPKADPMRESHVAAAMPSKVLEVKVKVGDPVKKGQVLMVTEAMKMEYALSAKMEGTVKDLYAAQGDMVESGDLLIELE